MSNYQQLELYKLLQTVLRLPIIVLVKGDWRTGKTDTSLLLAYLAMHWGLVDKIGSNIYTFNSPLVDYIDTTGQLKDWLHRDKTRKLFVFDEGLKWVYKRKAMSGMNVNLVTDILPEISKGHASMFLLSQIDSLDSDVLHPAFCRAVFEKLSKKVMVTHARDYPNRTFTNLPSCQSVIKFDPDRRALFFNRELAKLTATGKESLIYKVAQQYVGKSSFKQIGKELGLHQQQVKRELIKALKWFLDNYEESKPKT